MGLQNLTHLDSCRSSCGVDADDAQAPGDVHHAKPEHDVGSGTLAQANHTLDLFSRKKYIKLWSKNLSNLIFRESTRSTPNGHILTNLSRNAMTMLYLRKKCHNLRTIPPKADSTLWKFAAVKRRNIGYLVQPDLAILMHKISINAA